MRVESLDRILWTRNTRFASCIGALPDMSWIKSDIRSSLLGLLGGSSMSDSTLQNRIEEIRLAMLDALGDHAAGQFPLLLRRLR